MKLTTKYGWLPLLAIVIFLQACGDDDELSRKDLLVGIWEIQTADLTDYSITINSIPLSMTTIRNSPFADDAQVFEDTLASLSDQLFPAGTTINFNEDNTYLLTSPATSNAVTDTWSLSADEQEVTVMLGDDDITDNNLDQLIFSITELSNNSLTLLLTIDEDELELGIDGDSGFSVDAFTIEYTFSFRKQ